MRSYVIDELSETTLEHLAEYFTANDCTSTVKSLFWLPVEEELLTPVQQEHLNICGPYQMAVEFGEDSVKLELLVRAKNVLRCECVRYLTPEAERSMMQKLDRILMEIHNDETDLVFRMLS